MYKLGIIAVLLVVFTVSAQKTGPAIATQPGSIANSGNIGSVSVTSQGQTVNAIGTVMITPQRRFQYDPKRDITAYELALLLPYMAGGGMAEYGILVDATAKTATSRVVMLQLNAADIEQIKPAMRHLKELPK